MDEHDPVPVSHSSFLGPPLTGTNNCIPGTPYNTCCLGDAVAITTGKVAIATAWPQGDSMNMSPSAAVSIL